MTHLERLYHVLFYDQGYPKWIVLWGIDFKETLRALKQRSKVCELKALNIKMEHRVF